MSNNYKESNQEKKKIIDTKNKAKKIKSDKFTGYKKMFNIEKLKKKSF